VELCGEIVPTRFDAGRAGVMPGKGERSQVGFDEVLEYCALLDQGARDVPVKEAWETIVGCAEKDLREMTRAPTSYTLGNALQHEITPCTSDHPPTAGSVAGSQCATTVRSRRSCHSMIAGTTAAAAAEEYRAGIANERLEEAGAEEVERARASVDAGMAAVPGAIWA